MADDKTTPDVTNTHEGLDALSDEQIKTMETIVHDTENPYKDPITGKMNEDIPEDEVGVDTSEEDEKIQAAKQQLAVDRPEEIENAQQWEDPFNEDH